MAERCDTSSVRAFIRTAAREKVQKAPIKMLFPLMFLIFPALMIVLMYPAAYSVSTNLKGIL
jgi:tight adherence protein C